MINTSRYIMKKFEMGEVYPGYVGEDGILAKVIFLAPDHLNALVIKVDPGEALKSEVSESTYSRFNNAEKMRFTIKRHEHKLDSKMGVCPGGRLWARKMHLV
jgi:hypothetical protein